MERFSFNLECCNSREYRGESGFPLHMICSHLTECARGDSHPLILFQELLKSDNASCNMGDEYLRLYFLNKCSCLSENHFCVEKNLLIILKQYNSLIDNTSNWR